MIKEIDFKKDDRNELLYLPVELDTVMDQPEYVGVELLQHVNYFHKHLSCGPIRSLNNIAPADWVPVSRWLSLVCVSKRFRDVFEPFLKGHWYDVSNSDYSIFLLDNLVDALDLTKTKIVNTSDRDYWYTSIENETFVDSVDEEYLFYTPQDPYRPLATEKFERMYREHGFIGIQFYKDINFRRPSPMVVDFLRLKSYDDEGNVIERIRKKK